jgi:UPF0755 protein
MEPSPGTRYALTIPEGQTTAETAKLLKDVGLVKNEYAVQIQMWFYDYETYPGTYELSTAMTSKEILQILNVKPETQETKAGTSSTRSLETEPSDTQDSLQESEEGEPEQEVWLGEEGAE